MEGTIDLGWRKSSYSGNGGGDCTEVAAAPGTVVVRDSKDPGGPVLVFGRTAWETFSQALKAGLQRAGNPPRCRAGEGFSVSGVSPRGGIRRMITQVAAGLGG